MGFEPLEGFGDIIVVLRKSRSGQAHRYRTGFAELGDQSDRDLGFGRCSLRLRQSSRCVKCTQAGIA